MVLKNDRGEKRALHDMDLSLTWMDPVSEMYDSRDDGACLALKVLCVAVSRE